MYRQVDLCVVGRGPAGLSAAIYAVRSGLKVVLVGRDSGSLQRAEKIENYFGFVEPIAGLELLERGLSQARRLGVEVIMGEVTGITFQEQFEIDTTEGSFTAPCVILATGMPRRKPSIPGLVDFEGRGVSYCVTCDGFFFRGKNVAVIGNGEYACKEVSELKPVARRITIFTNGRPFESTMDDPEITIDQRKILRIEGDDFKVRRLILAGEPENTEEVLEIDGVFVAEGTATALDLALKLGVDNDGKAIIVDCLQQTNLPGLFAIGDCTGGIMQVAVAVGEGAKAGIAAATYLRRQKKAANP
jgi:thioredoxin reductase (NADPH)